MTASTESVNAARYLSGLFFDPERVRLVQEVIQRRWRDI